MKITIYGWSTRELPWVTCRRENSYTYGYDGE